MLDVWHARRGTRVSPTAPREHLADHRNVTVLVRLVVEPSGQLVHGELVDLHGESLGYFKDWARLNELLQLRLAKPDSS